MRDITVAEDPGAVVAERLSEAAQAGADIVLTGGSTPRRAYELAAQRDADWSEATAWFSDERCVAPDDPLSNFRMADEALLSKLSRPPRVMRMECELGPEAAAGAYEAQLREQLGPDPRFDLVLLGLGPDAHVASLFPGKPELDERERLVTAVPLAGMEPQVPRVTLTFPALNSAHEVVFLVSGEDKAQAVARAFGEPPDPEAPAARVSPPAGALHVVLDRAAAKALR
jgi:6-phosphogluconolactonase